VRVAITLRQGKGRVRYSARKHRTLSQVVTVVVAIKKARLSSIENRAASVGSGKKRRSKRVVAVLVNNPPTVTVLSDATSF
jgi:hypothetical protein